MKYSEKKVTLNFFVPLTEVSQTFQEGNEAQVTHYSKVAAPFKRVGGEGDSTHWGAPVRPVPRGSTRLKSGPDYTPILH